MNAWKPWEELITQSYYLLLKPNLKIVWIKTSVILSKMIFLPANSHMHIFNMLITSVQSSKLIAWILWEELITQTCYPILKPNLKIVYVKNAVIVSKMIFFPAKCTSSIAYNICEKFIWKLWEELIKQTCYPILKPNLKIEKKKYRNFVKNDFLACQKSYAHLHYSYNICAKFQIDCWQSLGGVDYTKLLPYV